MEHCKAPCKECPFRKDSLRGWLADYTPQELHNVVMSEVGFPCHMTHEEEIGWDDVKNYPMCAGALRYMRKCAKSPRNSEMAAIVRAFKPEDLENILGIGEFFDHHDLNKIYGKKK